MAEHESSIGASDEWYTARDIFSALELKFSLDPCRWLHHWFAPFASFTKAMRLTTVVCGIVFMNPPFGGRNETRSVAAQVPWRTAIGIAIDAPATSSAWFHRYALHAETWCFRAARRSSLVLTEDMGKAPGHGIVLCARM